MLLDISRHKTGPLGRQREVRTREHETMLAPGTRCPSDILTILSCPASGTGDAECPCGAPAHGVRYQGSSRTQDDVPVELRDAGWCIE